MNVQQLRYFTTVAHLENISRAAAYLHVSQSALTKQIQRLESELGVSLFDRNGKRITLNKAGMRFYMSSNMIINELKSAEEDITLMSSRQDHRVRIGASGIPSRFLECLGEFEKLHPGTEFIIKSRIEFEAHIDINEFDTLIYPDEYRFDKLNGFPFYTESYYYAVNNKSPLAKEKALNPEALSSQPVIFMQSDESSFEFPYRVSSAIGVHPQSIYFTDTRELHRRLISSGKAGGFVPKTEAESYMNDPGIKLLHVLDERFSRSMKICFLREKHLSNLGLAFREFTIRYFDLQHDLPGGG